MKKEESSPAAPAHSEFAELAALLNRVKRNPPAEKSALREFVQALDVHLPKDYFLFLLYSNGGVGHVGHQYVDFWPVEDLLAANQEYADSELSSGFLFFGSDGSGEGFAFDLRLHRPIICRVPFIGVEPGSAEPLGVSFHEFLESLLHE